MNIITECRESDKYVLQGWEVVMDIDDDEEVYYIVVKDANNEKRRFWTCRFKKWWIVHRMWFTKNIRFEKTNFD